VHPHGHWALWGVAWVTAGLTAFYMFRLVFMTFAGPSRVPHDVEHHVHESPWSMLGPLTILAVLSVVGGFIGWPLLLRGSARFEKFLEPIFENPQFVKAYEYSHSLEWLLMGLSVGIALISIAVAYRAYVSRPFTAERAARQPGPLRQILLNKYYVDELYDALFVNRTKDAGNVLGAFDLAVVDGGVNAVGWSTRMSGEVSKLWDKWVIDGLVNVIGFGTKVLSYPVRVVQTGLVQTYAWLITLGVLVFMAYYLLHFR
jgi:NADH-quinone oxidoreductase subunit L